MDGRVYTFPPTYLAGTAGTTSASSSVTSSNFADRLLATDILFDLRFGACNCGGARAAGGGARAAGGGGASGSESDLGGVTDLDVGGDGGNATDAGALGPLGFPPMLPDPNVIVVAGAELTACACAVPVAEEEEEEEEVELKFQFNGATPKFNGGMLIIEFEVDLDSMNVWMWDGAVA